METRIEDYLRPVEFILFSGFEAEQFMSFLSRTKEEKIGLIHLKDSQFLFSQPENFKLEGFKDVMVLLKPFNGECKYEEAETKILKEKFGRIDENDFAGLGGIKPEQSVKIYGDLRKHGYLTYNGFVTQKLARQYPRGSLSMQK